MKRRTFLSSAALSAAGIAESEFQASLAEVTGERKSPWSGGRDYSPVTGEERRRIPSACWQCVSRCGIVGYIENGSVVKIEGHPGMLGTRGRLCARGQAGINQIDHPDRLLHPLLRTGRRGGGEWKRISWKEALDLLVEGGKIAGKKVRGLKELRASGMPEKFMFHYGRTVGSDATILFDHFLPAYGTGTIGDHNSICVNAGGIARMLTPGPSAPVGMEKAGIVLNFGCSFLEAGFDHVTSVRRFLELLDRGTKVYTFDVRLSNTAARSTEWVPIKPGTDLAVILSICHVLMENGLHDTNFIRDHTNVTADELKKHLAGYTPDWAESVSGVPAAKIRSIAMDFVHLGPGLCTGLRGLFMHHNGVQAQRALYMLRAIGGGVDTERLFGPFPRWADPYPTPEGEVKSLDILDGAPGQYAFPAGHVSHQILRRIDEGPERPDIYMVYCHNPVYSNGACPENAKILEDESKIPFFVAVDVVLSETSELADLVLPDATYLERWTLEGGTSPDNVAEYYIRQPMHGPLGNARNFVDVACEIGARLELKLGFRSAEEFVRAACNATPGVREAGGFEYMKKHGVWHDRKSEPMQLPAGELELRSTALEERGLAALPTWEPVPEHVRMSDDDLILTTFKVAVQSHSRTQGCKWLTEIYHDNPAWIHPETAAARRIEDGDRIVVRSIVGAMITKARVTEGIHPQAIAISNSAGHWAWGEYASGRKGSEHRGETDSDNKWWVESGSHPNQIIPNRGDPIAGSMCWNDTIVRVSKI